MRKNSEQLGSILCASGAWGGFWIRRTCMELRVNGPALNQIPSCTRAISEVSDYWKVSHNALGKTARPLQIVWYKRKFTFSGYSIQTGFAVVSLTFPIITY